MVLEVGASDAPVVAVEPLLLGDVVKLLGVVAAALVCAAVLPWELFVASGLVSVSPSGVALLLVVALSLPG